VNVSRRVLVTGAGGFIGRWSLAPLLAAGFDVHAVLSPSGPSALASPGAAVVHRANLLDARAIDGLVGSVRPTHLLHFAWIATPGEYWQSADNYRWLTASTHLLRSFHRIGGVRAVMAGSCAEYDWSQASVCEERTTPLAGGPNSHASPYTECKVAMSRVLEEFGRAQQLSTAWGRIFFQFGPGEDPRRLVSSVIRELLSGREAACTHGRQIRSFLHVEDVGAAFAALLAGEVEGAVNVGSEERIAIAELLERIARHIGRPELLKLGARTAPASEPPVLVPEIGRLREEVGFRPKWTLDAGVDDTIRWWRNALLARGGAP
jgi:nucleoside-diphosphate-sugar epimerase